MFLILCILGKNTIHGHHLHLPHVEYINPKGHEPVVMASQEQSGNVEEVLQGCWRVIKPASLQKYPREVWRWGSLGGGG